MPTRFSRAHCALAALAIGAMAAPSKACEISVSGSALSLRGEIQPGDQYKFRDFLAGSGGVRQVYLASGGGSIQAAEEIGRQIRAAGLTTVVDAARDRCASACSLIFLSGAHRIYLHANAASGVSTSSAFLGLGFHQGAQAGTHGYSGDGTAQQIAICHEFGLPQAAQLVEKAPPSAIYGLSGEAALSMGIATALSMQ
jgi:hypothetical protein